MEGRKKTGKEGSDEGKEGKREGGTGGKKKTDLAILQFGLSNLL